jgi:hypothetical protein
MADVPASVGWMTVSGQMIVGIADSGDAGRAPDAVAALATVTFTPSAMFDRPLAVGSSGLLLQVTTVTASLDADGVLVDASGSPGVTLVAPQQPPLSRTDWTWTVTFAPIAPQSWKAFSFVFTGAPGEEKNVGTMALTEPSAGISQAVVYDAATQNPPYPAGFRPGIDLLLTPDGKIWTVDS